METMLLRTFQRQVMLECEFVLFSAQDLQEAMRIVSTRERSPGEGITLVFYAIQNLLNAAANISKALWGSGGKRIDERRPLRDSIGIENSSPLRSVTIRNHFEHFDERLEQWWSESKNHNIADRNLGPIGMIGGLEDIEMFRQFDPATGVVIFWGDHFNLRDLVDEVQRILPRLKVETEKPHWTT